VLSSAKSARVRCGMAICKQLATGEHLQGNGRMRKRFVLEPSQPVPQVGGHRLQPRATRCRCGRATARPAPRLNRVARRASIQGLSPRPATACLGGLANAGATTGSCGAPNVIRQLPRPISRESEGHTSSNPESSWGGHIGFPSPSASPLSDRRWPTKPGWVRWGLNGVCALEGHRIAPPGNRPDRGGPHEPQTVVSRGRCRFSQGRNWLIASGKSGENR